MDTQIDMDKWRNEDSMDYIEVINSINQAANKNEVFKKIYAVTRLLIPDILFKYYSITDNIDLNEMKIDTLKNQKIYLSDIESFNDPFDTRAYFYRAEVLMKHSRLRECEGRIMDDVTTFSRVSSFTNSEINCMPMWAHYASNHKGFCVSYDMNDKRNKQFSGCTFPVQYTSKRTDVTDLVDYQVQKIIEEVEKNITLGEKITRINDLSIVFMNAFFSNIKHESWSYEKEYRCTVSATSDGRPFFPAYPKEIYIGMKCSKEYQVKLIGVADEIGIPAYKMQFNDYNTKYELDYIRVN